MKSRLKFAALAFLLLAALYTLNWAFALLSMPSDAAAAAGFAIILAMIVIGPWLVKKILNNPSKSAAVALIMLYSAGSGACTTVGPGYVGIAVNSYGSEKGVQDYPLQTGVVWYNIISTTVFEYPTFVQTAKWTKDVSEGKSVNEEITFNSREGLQISADISLSYQLDPSKVPSFYVKFRSDKLDDFTHGFLRNVARDAFNEVGSTYVVEDIYGAKKEDLLKAIREKINAQVVVFGVEIQQFGLIGKPRLPEQVESAITAKIAATQQAIQVENEIRKAKAEAEKSVAQAEGEAKARLARAEGEAKSNIVLTNSLSTALLEWRKLAIQEAAVQRWDGRQPLVSGGSAMPVIQIPALAEAVKK